MKCGICQKEIKKNDLCRICKKGIKKGRKHYGKILYKFLPRNRIPHETRNVLERIILEYHLRQEDVEREVEKQTVKYLRAFEVQVYLKVFWSASYALWSLREREIIKVEDRMEFCVENVPGIELLTQEWWDKVQLKKRTDAIKIIHGFLLFLLYIQMPFAAIFTFIVGFIVGVFGEEGRISYRREPIPSDIRSRVWRRDGSQCVNCGSKSNLQFDHIIPVSKGGATTVENLQILCRECNMRKSNKI